MAREKISGIYIIECLLNGKVYIGSSQGVIRRFWEHRNALNNKQHDNRFLQNAWNKYGEDNFRFEMIEACPIRLLAERETFWMNAYDSFNHSCGYNILPHAYSSLGYRWKMAKESIEKHSLNKNVIDPLGNVVFVVNLREFCDINKLSSGSMSAMLNGVQYHHQGWRKMNKVEVGVAYNDTKHYLKTRCATGPVFDREYVYLDALGNKIVIKEFVKYCREHKLNLTKMRQVALGNSRYHKGYRQFTESELGIPFNKKNFPGSSAPGLSLRKHYTFVNPAGVVVEIFGLNAHCKKYGLDGKSMYCVNNGIYKQHKGWTKFKQEEVIQK